MFIVKLVIGVIVLGIVMGADVKLVMRVIVMGTDVKFVIGV